jgi:chromosome segregation ATPase
MFIISILSENPMLLDVSPNDIKNVLNEELSDFLFMDRGDIENQIQEIKQRISDMEDRIIATDEEAGEIEVDTNRIKRDTDEYRRELQSLENSNLDPIKQAQLREDIRAGEEAIARLEAKDAEFGPECSRLYSAKCMFESDLERLESQLENIDKNK